MVAQRTREIGVRMAFGAEAGSVRSAVTMGAVRLAAVGVVIGIALALGTTRLLSNLLFEVTTTDALTFTIAASVFVAGGMPVTPPPHPTRYIGNRCIERLFYNCEIADATRGHINDT